MELPVQISANFELSEAQERLLRQAVARLERFYGGPLGCRATVTVHRYANGNPRSYDVRLDVTAAGGEFAITRQPKRSLREAIKDAFDAARRKLQDYARRQRRDVKRHTPPALGTVIKLFAHAGYGFIGTTDGREIYFDRNSVVNGGFDRLEEGDDVRFVERAGEKGPMASTVVRLRRRRRQASAPG
jgi:cold shock CspA family protein